MKQREMDLTGARVIAGSGRSGTTWVQDCLADANSLRTIFEPLHPDGVSRAKPFANRYLHPAHEDADLERFMGRMLSGADHSLWPNTRVRLRRIIRSRDAMAAIGAIRTIWSQYPRYWRNRRQPVITKFIRANLMLGWLSRQLGIRPVLILRHPGGVVASKMKANPAAWHDPFSLLESHLSDSALIADHLEACRALFSEKLSPVELHTALWCIENVVPLRQADEYGIAVAHYERLLMNDDHEWSRVLEHLRLERRPSSAALSEPSQQSSEIMKRNKFSDAHVSRWMETFSDTDLCRIDAVLEAFGITVYSASDPLPRPAATRFRQA